jgi:hypothetical protein
MQELIKAPDLSLITKSHENMWVALSLDYKKILGSAKSLISLKEKIGQVKAIFTHVLPADIGYAPNVR